MVIKILTVLKDETIERITHMRLSFTHFIMVIIVFDISKGIRTIKTFKPLNIIPNQQRRNI